MLLQKASPVRFTCAAHSPVVPNRRAVVGPVDAVAGVKALLLAAVTVGYGTLGIGGVGGHAVTLEPLAQAGCVGEGQWRHELGSVGGRSSQKCSSKSYVCRGHAVTLEPLAQAGCVGEGPWRRELGSVVGRSSQKCSSKSYVCRGHAVTLEPLAQVGCVVSKGGGGRGNGGCRSSQLCSLVVQSRGDTNKSGRLAHTGTDCLWQGLKGPFPSYPERKETGRA